MEKLTLEIKQDNKNKKYTISIKNDYYKDSETGKLNSGILINVKERLSNFRGGSDVTATWGYNLFGTASVGMRSSLIDSKARSSGDYKRRVPIITIINKKIEKTSISVNKKWFSFDGKEKQMPKASISYKVIQIATKKEGKSTEIGYIDNQTLTVSDKWTRTHSNLPKKGKDQNDQEIFYTYYVVESSMKDYVTSYTTDKKESKTPSDTAILSGSITIKNTEKMKFVLPETGGTGTYTIYMYGSLLTILGVFLLIKKNNSINEGC